jgi:DNA (cytosine-5)-methyltransferase 1
MCAAYYNENDPKAAAWLRELIKRNLISPGEVDERSILDVPPGDLVGFTQCHFFAGIGVWSYALRCAGWPDDRPVWTGSCPCQPFSAAGKGGGFADERHLWPAWFHLIGVRKPPVVFGEQVAGKDGGTWLDLVHADLESVGYACGPVVAPAAGFGAPQGRHRIYFVAVADAPHSHGRPGECETEAGTRQDGERRRGPTSGGSDGIVGDTVDEGLQGIERREQHAHEDGAGSERTHGAVGEPSPSACLLAYPDGRNPGTEGLQRGGEHGQQPKDRGPCNGFWRNADWLPCRDGKMRPIEPGTFPLAHRAAARVGRLRGYGNAIVAPQAEAFVRAYLEVSR